MARLFAGLWPSAEAQAVLEAMERPEIEGWRWVSKSRLHVTLRFFGDADIDEVIEALSAVRHEPVTVSFGTCVTPLGNHVLMVPVQGADELALAIAEASAHVGEPPHKKGFTGHITVGRLRDELSGRALPQASSSSSQPSLSTSIPEIPVQGSFVVNEFALVSSVIGEPFEIVKRFPLKGEP